MANKAHKNNIQLLDTTTIAAEQEKEKIYKSTKKSTGVSEQKKDVTLSTPPASIEAVEHEIGNEVSREYLVNKLNFTNFQDGTILINFKHTKYNRIITLHAKPKPCLGNHLDCLWVETQGLDEKLRPYKFDNFFVIDGKKLLSVSPEEFSINDEGISFELPETCYEINSRKVTRHSCEGIEVQLIQSSSLFYGSLIDFNAVSFCIKLKTVPPQTFRWLDKSLPANLIFSDRNEVLYAGGCNILRNTRGHKTRKYVIEPLEYHIKRYQNKDHRSTRQKVIPSPDIIFRHPFTKKLVTLKALDISGSGFSVEEDENSAVLLPGMVIPELELSFANSSAIKCKAQVVYRKISGGGKRGMRIKCGIAVLDMLFKDNMKLLSILHQAKESNSYVCNRVDLDALWDFFFETGFIYPGKYEFIQKNKKKIKETYEKLYARNQNIARHFIYQDKDHISGHMAMVRFYRNTWMIHHHAARKSALNRAGLIVLNQIGDFTYNCHRLYSLHMNFLICYFRPDNKFPSRVFGGAARYIKNPKQCSVDAFAYFHFKTALSVKHRLSRPWELTETRREDLLELESFYEHESGGLMLAALDLEPGTADFDELIKEYQKIGFKRERLLFSLKKNKRLKAVVMVDISDIGLNLSDLTNSVKVVVVDSDDLSREVLYGMLALLTEKIDQKDIPILLFPAAYAEQKVIPYEKTYNLWVLGTQDSDPYFKYIDRLLRFT